MPAINADFLAAIKGKRTVESLKNAVDTVLANAKIAANDIADKIQINLATLDENKEHAFLFNDVATLVMKAPDDLHNVIKLRIAEHNAEQQRRLDAERERIRKEEADKLAKEAADKAEADRQQAEKREHANTEAAKQVQILAPHPIPSESEAGTLAGARTIVSASSQAVEQPGDMAWEIAGLVAQMKQAEQKLVLHYCERIIAERQEAA